MDKNEIKKLAESEEKFRKMIEMANDAIMTICVNEAVIIDANPKSTDLTGYTIDELKDKKIWELHPENEIGAAKKLFEDVKITGRGYCDRMHFLRKDGSLLHIEVSASMIEYCGRKVIQRICRDITKQIELEKALQKAKDELEHKVEERTRELQGKQAQLVQTEKMASLGSLVAGVAHEINTPLGALKSNYDLFIRSFDKIKKLLEEKNANSDDINKILNSISDLNEVNATAAERIVKIVNTLRNFARLDRAEMDTVDIHDGLESTLTLVHHELKNRINLVLKYGDLPEVRCYPNQLNQVFMNLLVNASQAIESKGTITIKTYKSNNDGVIEITDTGKGIPEENRARIFDPGFTTKGAGIGTGLGLSIVHQIIEDHKGKIEVESEVGKGTTFRIIIPIG